MECHLLTAKRHGIRETNCPRCGAKLQFRKTTSLSRTWALLITSLILFFPANLLPIMNGTYLGE
ncbi:MAG: paraquat-inducible protein A, partial [Desulfobacteraceae bacterium]|nr:paraquat-inducible protein A [Desulfobacteraceae bacterium]